jgi:hypothetical protein
VMLHTRSCDIIGAYPLRPGVAVRHREEEEYELLAEAAGVQRSDGDDDDDDESSNDSKCSKSDEPRAEARQRARDKKKRRGRRAQSSQSETELETDSEDERLIQVATHADEELWREEKTYEDMLSASTRPRRGDYGSVVQSTSEENSLQTRINGLLRNVSSISGVGTDLYTITILLETACIIYAALAFFLLSGATSGSFIQSVIDNNLPGYLVVLLLLMVLVMVVDRILYTYSSHQAVDAQLKKFIFHCVLALGYSIFYIYWFAEIATVNRAGGAALFMFKVGYLCLSGQQIRRGYPLFRRHDPMTHSTDNSTLFALYMNVPFLWDLRMLLDWTFSRTTLSFDDFVKVENIAAVVYSRYGNIEGSNETRGYALPFSKKVVSGFLLFAVCILLIFFPLMYYSTFNPSVGPNYVTAVQGRLEVETFGDLYTSGVQAAPASTLISAGLRAALERLYAAWFVTGLLSSTVDTQLVSLESCSSTLWSVSPSGRSAMAAVLRNHLRDPDLYSPLVLNFLVTIQQSRLIATGSGSNQLIFTIEPDAEQMLQVIENSTKTALTADSPQSSFSLDLPHFFEPTVVGAGDGVRRYSASRGWSEAAGSATCRLTLNANLDTSSGVTVVARYWCFLCQGLFHEGNAVPSDPLEPDYLCANGRGGCDRLPYADWTSEAASSKPANSTAPYFLVSSERTPGGKSLLPINIGIIALYATFILSIGNIIRSWLTTSPSSIITEEMHDPSIVARLVSFIYLSRGGGRGEATDDLVLEEALFLELLDLIRSPERLLRETGLRRNAYDSKGRKIPIKPFLSW